MEDNAPGVKLRPPECQEQSVGGVAEPARAGNSKRASDGEPEGAGLFEEWKRLTE